MRKVAATVLVSLAALVGLAACSSGISAEDAYKIGCPAVDTAAGSGSLVNKATVAGLKQLSESGALDAEPQQLARRDHLAARVGRSERGLL